MSARKRILFLAEGATMAHFVRPLALADSVNPAEYEVFFRAPARLSHHLTGKPYDTGTLDTMPGEQFLDNIAHGRPLFPQEVLRRYVLEDVELFRAIRPDLIIGDMRLSLPISARLQKIPCAVIMNAYWSPYAKRRYIIPELPITRRIPPRLLNPIFRITAPIAFARHVAEMNRVRKEFGISPLPLDLRRMYTDGDYVLYPDVPEFVPTPGAPPSHHYVGICDWAPSLPEPEWWGQMCEDPRPKVFVSLGSSGPVRVLPALMQALERLPVAVVLSRSGRTLPETNMVKTEKAHYVADLLPFVETAARSSIVVSHGGSGGLYPAMAAGTPVLAIPSNADQQLSTACLIESGAGLGVRVEEAKVGKLHAALRELLARSQYTESAKAWKVVYAAYSTPKLLKNFLNLSKV